MLALRRKSKAIFSLVVVLSMLLPYFPVEVSAATPTIDTITPEQGTTAGGTQVTITGTNFASNAKVLFGASEGQVISVSGDGTIITVKTPQYTGVWPEGVTEMYVNVTVQSGGYNVIKTNGFKYIPSSPQIHSVTPEEGTAGDVITIDGSEFIQGAIVVIGGIDSPQVTFVDSTLIKAKVPALASGWKRVRVTNPDRQTVFMDDAFFYKKSTPSITKVDPAKGPIGDETETINVTITGNNFVPGVYEAGHPKAGQPITRVFFGDLESPNVNVVNQQTIIAKTPATMVRGKRHVIVDVDEIKAIRENAFEYISNPKITGLSPSSGNVLGGESVNITGEGFMAGASVYFGTKRATNVEVKTDTLISVITPPYDYPGEVAVRVVNTDGGEATTTTGSHYTYLQSNPTITNISPDSGSVLGGTLITITGTDFRSGIKLYIDGKEVSDVTRISSTELKAVTPPNSREGKKDVKVVNQDKGQFTLEDGFTYTRSQPTISTISPGSCSTVEQSLITIIGTNFMTGATVKVGNKFATEVKVISDTEITARVPEGTVGLHDVVVTNVDGGEAVKVEGFQYTPSSPVIDEGPINVDVEALLGSSLPPGADLNTGSTYGGTEIRIRGSEFSYSAQVKIGGKDATILSIEKDYNLNVHTIRALTPPGEVGEKTLTIINPDGRTVHGTFRYIVTPTITGITPNEGTTEGGTFITVTGARFNTGPEGLKLFIGGAEAIGVTVESSTKLTAFTPVNSEGEKDVVIINMDSDLGSHKVIKGFRYKLPPSSPVIESIQPVTGPTAGGNEVEIKGTDLRSGVKVYFGSKEAQVVKIETIDEGGTAKNIITCIAPSNVAGETDVKVVNPDNNYYVVANGYTYKIAERALTVSSITPNSGLIEGGTFVTVRGANFVVWQNVGIDPEDGKMVYKTTNVTIGGNPLTNINRESSQKITGYTPGGTVGPQDVIVKIVHVKDDGMGGYEEVFIEESVKLVGGFTYKLPQSQPVITSVTPREGPTSGGTDIIIRGEDFVSGAEVYIGDYKNSKNKALYVNVINPQEIRATTPSTTQLGSRDVYVINPDGGRAVLEDGFVYRGNILIITSITPNSGTVLGSTYATIKGANFIEGTKVNIGTEAAYSVTVIDPETITLYTPANTPGPKDVVVYNPFGEARLKSAFIYYIEQSRPVITALSKTEGTAAGGEEIRIYGFDFRSGASVTFAGTAAKNVFVMSPNEIRVTTPPGVPGWVDITVTNSDGGSYVLESGFLYISNPIITEIFPNQGSVQKEVPVTITGSNFDDGAKVYIDGEEVPYIKVVNETTIKIRTPIRANPGYVNVVVENPDGGKKILYNGFRYRIPNTAPNINSIVPDQGPVDGGTVITIKGSDFQSDAVVLIGDYQAINVQVIDPYTITAKTPPGSEGPKDVYVINLADTGQAVFSEGFEYKIPTSKPTISSIEPTEGTVYGGTDVIIKGTDFRAGAIVIIGGNEAVDVEIVSPIKIRAKTPPGSHGKKDVTVMNTDAGSATLEKAFEYKAPATMPEIHDVTPTQGTVYGGTHITITGIDFVPGARVTIGGEPSQNVVVLNSQTIRAYTPPHSPGEKEVAVTNPDTGLARWDGLFTYIVPDSFPVIDEIAPNRGTTSGGTYITIKGRDFRKDLKVLIDGIEAEVKKIENDNGQEVDGFTVISGTRIIAVTPPGSPGKKDVIVENPDTGLAVKERGFEYVLTTSEITLSNINPNKGTIYGGTPVTITGNGFNAGAKVFIGGVETRETVVIDSQTIKARTAPNTPGVKNVTVQNPDGASTTLENAFEYRIPTTFPKITLLDPNKGPTYGGINVTIFGENFEPGAIVYIGQNQAEVISVNPTQIRIVLPEGTVGPKDVIVINPDTGLAHLEEGFTYLDYPQITKIEPSEGPMAGGTVVTITGNGFKERAVVLIGGRSASEVQVINSTTIRAKTPSADESGYVDVQVINPDGGAGILKNGFYYIAPRTVPEAPTGFRASTHDATTIKLTWNPSEHANYYEIFASFTGKDGSYKFLDKTDKTVFYVIDLEPDQKYYFMVRAVNELGSSPFSSSDYAYTDDDDGSQDVKVADIVTSAEGNSQVFIINSISGLKNSCELNIEEDFRRLTKKTVIVTYDAIFDLSKDLIIKTSDLQLQIPRSTLRGNLGRVDRDEQDTSGVKIIIEKADKQETERMLKRLPRGHKPLTDIFSIQMETQIGKKTTPNPYFSLTLTMFYDYATYLQHNKQNITLYYYYPSNNSFIEVSKIQGRYWYGGFNANIIMPGYYLLTTN